MQGFLGSWLYDDQAGQPEALQYQHLGRALDSPASHPLQPVVEELSKHAKETLVLLSATGDGRCAAGAFGTSWVGTEEIKQELILIAAELIHGCPLFAGFEHTRGLSHQDLTALMLEGKVWGDHEHLVAWGMLSGLNVTVYETTRNERLNSLQVRVCELRNSLFSNAETVHLVLYMEHYYLVAPAAKLVTLEGLTLRAAREMERPIALTFEAKLTAVEFHVQLRQYAPNTATPREQMRASQGAALCQALSVSQSITAAWASEHADTADDYVDLTGDSASSASHPLIDLTTATNSELTYALVTDERAKPSDARTKGQHSARGQGSATVSSYGSRIIAHKGHTPQSANSTASLSSSLVAAHGTAMARRVGKGALHTPAFTDGQKGNVWRGESYDPAGQPHAQAAEGGRTPQP